MSYKRLEKFYEDVQKRRREVSPELYSSNSFYIKPFSKRLEQKESHYIYFRNEKIPITEKNPELKTILRHEFSKKLKEFNRILI